MIKNIIVQDNFILGILWLEGYMPLSNAMVTIFTMCASLGPDIFPTLAGQFIEYQPMFLFYLTMVLILIFSILFIVAWILMHSVKKTNEELLISESNMNYKSIK